MQHATIDPHVRSVTVTAPPPCAEPVSDAEELARRALEIGYRAALGVLGSREAAEDVAQDVAIKALRHAGALRHPDAWLYRVATRAALREARRTSARRRRERELHDRDPAPAAADPSPSQAILPLLDGLPTRQRAALTLRYVFDLSDDAIAAAMGCRAATVRAHLFQGRAALRARLADEGGHT